MRDHWSQIDYEMTVKLEWIFEIVIGNCRALVLCQQNTYINPGGSLLQLVLV